MCIRDSPCRNQRAQRKLACRRVAPGSGDQPTGANIFAVELGQAINSLGLQVGRRMLPVSYTHLDVYKRQAMG